MLVTSQLPIQTAEIFYSFLTCTCAPHFEKGSATNAWRTWSVSLPKKTRKAKLRF